MWLQDGEKNDQVKTALDLNQTDPKTCQNWMAFVQKKMDKCLNFVA